MKKLSICVLSAICLFAANTALANPGPPTDVPDAGATALLMAVAFAGLAAVRSARR